MASLHIVIFAASCALLAASASSLAVFSVGDQKGWKVPANGTETYNHWAKRNRFQVGDILNFKYGANDSVLIVGHDDYKMCHTGNPLGRFTDGDTRVTLDRAGIFFFVSGVPGHCEAGQRMIARVMNPAALTTAPAAAPPAGMPPTASARVAGPVPSSSPVARPVPGSGSGFSSGTATPATTTPAPAPPSSGAASSRLALGVASSMVAGLVVLGLVSLFVLV